MHKILKVTSLLALAVASLGIYSGAQQAPALATNHVLKGTFINNGNYNANAAAGTFTPIDTALSVSCPGTSGTCTIEADMWIQNASDGGGNTVCLFVDGSESSGCPYETSGTSGIFETISASWPVTVEHGTHTVQTYVYSNDGEFVGFYTTNYRVYKP
jgi:hypothetical protein